jgi:hypothetical protein
MLAAGHILLLAAAGTRSGDGRLPPVQLPPDYRGVCADVNMASNGYLVFDD